jgi:hypothetical protein
MADASQPYVRSPQPSLPQSQRLWFDNEFKKIEDAFRTVATDTGGAITGIGDHLANTVLAGPTSGAAAAPTFRALTGADLPNPSATTLGGVQSIAPVASKWISSISTSGVPSLSQPSFADLSGSLLAAQLPNPTSTTLGGVKSSSAASHQFATGINTSGALTYAQPSAGDISGLAASATTDTTNAANISTGTLSGARLPTPTALILGGVKSATAASHQFATGIDTTGALTFAQPAASDISGLAASATTDTTNASNISSGLLAIARGGTGTATPGIVAGASISVTGSWPNQTVAFNIGNQSANFIYGGPASGAAAAPGFRALVAADLPGFGSGDVSFAAGGGIGTIANAAVTYAKIQNVSATSRFIGRKTAGAGSPEELTASDAKTILAIASSDVSGLAASATTDATNASNISSGTLSGARLPNPSSTVLGGVKSATAATHQFATGISTAGALTFAQPAASDITGLATSATTDTTNASNITSGVLAVANGGTGDTGSAWTSYTPTITASSGTFNSVSATGAYKTIGKTVHVRVEISIGASTGNGTAAGLIYFTLPVNVAGTGFYYGMGQEEAATNNVLKVRFASDTPTKAAVQTINLAYAGGNGYIIRASGTYQSV